MEFMGYTIQDNEIFRPRLGDSTSSDDEDEEDEDDNEEASQEEEEVEGGPNEVAAPIEEPHPMPMETEPSDKGRGATYLAEFERQMEQRMDSLDCQLHSMQSDIQNLTQDFA